MPKITINGEIFDYELTRPMSEALAIEEACKRRYAEWESEFLAGSAWGMAVFVWTVWRRDGRDVPLEDILSGKADFDYFELQKSLRAPAEEEDPTGAGTSSDPAGTDGTSAGTRPSSQKSSASGRGKSASSAPTTSTT